jgi:hypothetical protein
MVVEDIKISYKSEGSYITPGGKLDEDVTMILDITTIEKQEVEHINVTLEIPK